MFKGRKCDLVYGVGFRPKRLNVLVSEHNFLTFFL